jgi:putative Mn2+ efflux pump MntP
MDTINIVLIIVGAIVTLIGIAAFINPNFAKIINVPGGPKLKSIVALIVGIILVIVGLIR